MRKQENSLAGSWLILVPVRMDLDGRLSGSAWNDYRSLGAGACLSGNMYASSQTSLAVEQHVHYVYPNHWPAHRQGAGFCFHRQLNLENENKMTRLAFTSLVSSLLGKHGAAVCAAEHCSQEQLHEGLASGSMVLLANPAHKNVIPTLIGQPARVKVNANIGTSPLMQSIEVEMEKLDAAWKAGADAVMDLSTAGDLDAIRKGMLDRCPLPLGTVPIYSMAQKRADAGQDPAEFAPEELLDEIRRQALQGVDFMTLHVGVTRAAAALADRPFDEGGRLMGIVSRGGSILTRWMRKHDRENPLLERYDEVLAICAEHNVTLSLGDGLRPGAGADAGDAAQWEEVAVLAECARRARAAGVQAMIEGPGHVPLHLVEGQIQTMKRLCGNAPLYVLGPLVTDAAPGYDHIAGAIGGALAVTSGADFLCYLTPAEHLTLPCVEDVRQGVMASRVAAHSAEVALGRAWAVERNLEMSRARKALDWNAMSELALDKEKVNERRKDHAHEKECAMCGKFCAIRMLEQETI